MEERARAGKRRQNTLEDPTLKLGEVLSDVLGQAARAMLDALVAGDPDPRPLADLAIGRGQAPSAEVERAVTGQVRAHQRVLLGEHVPQIESLESAIRRVGEEMARRFSPPDPPPEDVEGNQTTTQHAVQAASQASPAGAASALTWQDAVERSEQITGSRGRAAEGLLAESGVDRSRFKSAQHRSWWAGVCPGNHERAGKRLSGTTRQGPRWVRRLLIQSAHAAAHRKNTDVAAQEQRIARRRGPAASGAGGGASEPGEHLAGLA